MPSRSRASKQLDINIGEILSQPKSQFTRWNRRCSSRQEPPFLSGVVTVSEIPSMKRPRLRVSPLDRPQSRASRPCRQVTGVPSPPSSDDQRAAENRSLTEGLRMPRSDSTDLRTLTYRLIWRYGAGRYASVSRPLSRRGCWHLLGSTNARGSSKYDICERGALRQQPFLHLDAAR